MKICEFTKPELMEDVLWEKIDEIGVDSSESVCL